MYFCFLWVRIKKFTSKWLEQIKRKTVALFDDFYFSLVCWAPQLQEAGGLILFAAEDEGRTEEPTERRKRREREKGRVPKSQEVTSTAVTLGVLIILFFLAGWLLSRIFMLFRYFLNNTHDISHFDSESLQAIVLVVFRELGFMLGPLFLIAAIVAIAGNCGSGWFSLFSKALTV